MGAGPDVLELFPKYLFSADQSARNLPVNRPVIVYLWSKDMVHRFTLPQMRVKQNVVSGIAQPVWFTPTYARLLHHSNAG